ncbi:TetR/AcrR family transcriptional regulator [Nonomuraea sp. NEAU-A123]|uniref:TetR/AcrR family transcriptional regulator n=1 Tax=Nonomuraea sp. NEAU-A123 TaxID=2839649 RepID=UPI001BE44F01|nr:TetR/AcrR family transcriptional regulator [Nonomuraea sp. NEAU-A123]MBT2228936.1 TetR/AcrR family transcriptional regulator [Nonomuraea sp. NEAU-A123]
MSSETHRTRNRRGEGSRLRGEIIAAATALLEQAGSEDAITLRGVARQAGVSAPSIYAHFADREEIIGAVVAQAFTELDEALVTTVEGETDPARRLWKLCEAYLDFAESKPHRYRVAFGRHNTAEPTGSAARLEDLSGGQAFTRLIEAVADYTKSDRANDDPANGSSRSGDCSATDASANDGTAQNSPAQDRRTNDSPAQNDPSQHGRAEDNPAQHDRAQHGPAKNGYAASRSPQVAATALWVSLHGYASLTASVPLFPWPDRREMLSTLLASIVPAP